MVVSIDQNLPIVWILKFRMEYTSCDQGIHAREWMSPAFVTWLINELVVNNTAHPQYTENMDWYFMPVVNPDGYEYSHTVVKYPKISDGATEKYSNLN